MKLHEWMVRTGLVLESFIKKYLQIFLGGSEVVSKLLGIAAVKKISQ